MHMSAANTDAEIGPFDYSRENWSFKHSSNLNLVTDGSENINDETDIWLNIKKAQVKHSKKVSFVTATILEDIDARDEFEPSLRPQSTISHLSIAEEYIIRTTNYSRIAAESWLRYCFNIINF